MRRWGRYCPGQAVPTRRDFHLWPGGAGVATSIIDSKMDFNWQRLSAFGHHRLYFIADDSIGSAKQGLNSVSLFPQCVDKPVGSVGRKWLPLADKSRGQSLATIYHGYDDVVVSHRLTGFSLDRDTYPR